MHVKRLTAALATAGALTLSLAMPVAAAAPAKNVVLFISDGASWGTWDMTSYWEYGQKGMQPYDSFPVKLGMTTYPLNTSTTPTFDDTPKVSYDPAKAWDTTPNTGSYGGTPNFFNGYDYIKRNYVDSAAAGTAIATGRKTYNNAIDWSNQNQPMRYLTQDAKALGKSTGAISSVPFTHATPAVFGAQNVSRNNYGAISEMMIHNPDLDLIMGAGHPWFNNNNLPRGTASFNYMSETAWNTLNSAASPRAFHQTKADFEALANGTLQIDRPAIFIPQVNATLQYSRTGVHGTDPNNPSGIAFNPNVPSLKTMTEGALNYLSRNPNGFFVMIEGGAVDWAAHANDTARIIEEQMDFNASVKAAIQWVETKSSWDETLMIVLTDHGNGMPMGPNSHLIPFEPIENRGKGVLPGVRWHYGTHTNENTLFFAKGAGAELFYNYVDGTDPGLRDILGFNDGRYIDNTDVYHAINAAMVPEPEAYALMLAGLGLLAMAVRRRKQG
jgi:alkaline phosphatase